MRSTSRFVRIAASLAAASLVLVAGCASTAPAGPSAPRSAEDAIWALEREYWEHNRAADIDKIASAWHEEFLGWPQGEPGPVGKEEARSFARRSYSKPDVFTFEIEPAGIRILGEVAIVHYAVRLASKEPISVGTRRPEAEREAARREAAPKAIQRRESSRRCDKAWRPRSRPKPERPTEIGSKDGEGRESRTALRITHTLIREGDVWRILGGMSSREPP